MSRLVLTETCAGLIYVRIVRVGEQLVSGGMRMLRVVIWEVMSETSDITRPVNLSRKLCCTN